MTRVCASDEGIWCQLNWAPPLLPCKPRTLAPGRRKPRTRYAGHMAHWHTRYTGYTSWLACVAHVPGVLRSMPGTSATHETAQTTYADTRPAQAQNDGAKDTHPRHPSSQTLSPPCP